MAFVLAPEAVEGAMALGEGAETLAPEIEAEGAEAEQAVKAEYEEHAQGLKDQESDPWKSSMSNLFMYNMLANQSPPQAPVVVNNNVNNNLPPAQQQVEDKKQQENVETLQTEEKQLKEEQQEIQQLQERPKSPDVMEKIKRYTQIYQKNLGIFQKQIDQFNSIYETSKSYQFY